MIVREIELFKGIDPKTMDEIAGICNEEEAPKDTVLFEKGHEAEALYILQQGTVNLIIKNGGTLIYGLSDPGQVFGWSTMVESGVYTASAVCATDLRTIKIERAKLDKVFEKHPEVGLKVLKRLARVVSQRLSNAYRDLLSARGQDTTPSYG